MVELFPHQVDAVDKISNGKVLHGGVGSGKSLTVLAYYVKKESPRDIYVITTAKKRDSLEWEGEAAKFGIGTDKGATLHGRIIIDSWNNIGKYVDVEEAFFIFDEQRLIGSGTWVRHFYKIAKKNNWVLLSATPGDTWMDYVPLFVANGLYKNATQFKREHVIYAPYSKYPKILRYVGTATLEKYRNMLLVEMPFLKHTERIIQDVYVEYDLTLFNRVVKDKWHPFENRPLRDASEMFYTMRKVNNNNPSRLEKVLELLEDHPKIVIFYNFDYELEMLRSLSSVVEVAEWNGHRKQQIPKTDSWLYLVQYTSGCEGWNCTDTNAMIFFSLTYSYRNFEQAQGRIDRLDTPFQKLYYYVLVSGSAIDTAVRRSLKEKRLFNERTWAAKELGMEIDFENGLYGV